MNLMWLLRMARWARRPPSEARVKLVLGAIALALLIVGLAHFGLWPDWAQLDPARRHFLLP